MIDMPSDDALLELGRLVFAATELERVVYWMSRTLDPERDPWSEDPIGPCIDNAIARLAQLADDSLRVRIETWLTAAKSALQDRNTVVHAEPVMVAGVSSEDPNEVTWSDKELHHFPRPKRGEAREPPVRTPLTVDGLRPIREHLQAAKDGWIELLMELREKGNIS